MPTTAGQLPAPNARNDIQFLSRVIDVVSGRLCTDLDARGCTTGEIAWVSNLRFYGKCGAQVSRVFLGGKLGL